jgi:ATP-dependent Clp protease ATP-binding subunit ClpC
MFERYTESARRMLFFARYESSQLGSTVIETEHLLLGLVREPRGVAGRMLEQAGIRPEQIRREIEAEVAAKPKISTSVEIPFAAEVKRVLEFAAEEADRLKHNYIGTEHVLAAMVREESSLAGRLLKRHGLRLDALRSMVKEAGGKGDLSDHGDLGSQVINVIELIDGIAGLTRHLAGASPGSAETARVVAQIEAKLAELRGLFGR